eukprot:3434718-Alexandrium_andersonii.AAC.1
MRQESTASAPCIASRWPTNKSSDMGDTATKMKSSEIAPRQPAGSGIGNSATNSATAATRACKPP